jgi:alcohol dehydrogenase
MGVVIAHELEILGSHGMQAHAYPEMWALITSGRIRPKELLGKIVSLKEGGRALMEMDQHDQTGVTVIDPLIQ